MAVPIRNGILISWWCLLWYFSLMVVMSTVLSFANFTLANWLFPVCIYSLIHSVEHTCFSSTSFHLFNDFPFGIWRNCSREGIFDHDGVCMWFILWRQKGKKEMEHLICSAIIKRIGPMDMLYISFYRPGNNNHVSLAWIFCGTVVYMADYLFWVPDWYFTMNVILRKIPTLISVGMFDTNILIKLCLFPLSAEHLCFASYPESLVLVYLSLWLTQSLGPSPITIIYCICWAPSR